MSNVLETTHLSKRYGRQWALQDCTLALPAGRVAALAIGATCWLVRRRLV
jgi:ABC-2 type transport system ATP-binding protein